MKRSIKHLPKCTQDEINSLLGLILRHIPCCCMVVLYGSYARGNYVLWDEREEFGVRTSYQSDLDIMVVIASSGVKHIEDILRTKVTTKYHELFSHRRHASPQFIVEHINTLNRTLSFGQYFFTEIVKDGIRLHNTQQYKFAKALELSFKDIKEIAQSEFSRCYPFALSFLRHGYFDLQNEDYVIGSFEVHQACERLYHAISLVFTNYRPKAHKLVELSAMVKEFSRDLSVIFPQSNDFEKRCFDLLCRAYIEARYNKDFTVNRQELEYMIERTELLSQITLRICTEKIASYDSIPSK